MVQAGAKARATDVTAARVLRKGTSQSVTSSTTVVDDNQLVLDLPVGLWRVELFLHALGVAAGDIRVTYTNTGTMSFLGRTCFGAGASSTDTLDGTGQFSGRSITSEVVYGTTSTTTNAGIYEDLLIDVTAAGELQLRWAQGTSNGTATQVTTSSRFYLTKMEEY